MTSNTRSSVIPNTLAFYASEPHQCNYLPHKQALTVFADPNVPMTTSIYSRIIEYGFRRSGEYVYIPRCPNCDACISVRIPVNDFSPSRNQRRVMNKNADLSVHNHPPVFNEEHYQLYRTYLNSRHRGGGMENPTVQDYVKFLASSWSHTVFYEIRRQQQLIGVTVADHLHTGMSAVYTFFDPNEEKLSPGSYAILWLVEQARRLEMRWLYLGYYIPNCQKMSYKDRFRPLEAFINGQWRKFSKNEIICL
ncbi:MAG: arginyltransferase [Gammaproteobacteria bacterium]|jgi:arginine-tRNA-protein transferase|nr:arginyltransferase [Gammaproteobacteria bacterium]